MSTFPHNPFPGFYILQYQNAFLTLVIGAKFANVIILVKEFVQYIYMMSTSLYLYIDSPRKLGGTFNVHKEAELRPKVKLCLVFSNSEKIKNEF